MNFEELEEFVNAVDIRIRENYGNYEDEEKRALARMVKITEEVGELAELVMANAGFQRDEKLTKQSRDDLMDEFADVIITTMLLAKTMNVDVKDALQKKIDKIKKRPKKI